MKKRPWYLRLILMCLIFCTLAFAGCDDGDDGDPGPAGPPGQTGPPGPPGPGAGGPGTGVTPNPEAAEVVVFYVDDKGTSDAADDVWRSQYELGLGGTASGQLPATQDTFSRKYSGQIVKEDGGFALKLVNLTNNTPATYPLFITYGGERNFKQRYVVTLPGNASKHISPLQFNDRYTEHPAGLTVKWIGYNPQRWFNVATNSLTTPAGGDAFDGDCAGCHQTGYTLVKNALGQEVALPGEAVHFFDGEARTFVGSSRCLSCHGDKENWGQTLHKIVHRKPLEFSPHQAKGAQLYLDTINRGILLSLGVINDDDTPNNPGATTAQVSPMQVDTADPNGAIDFDLDGDLDEINIGCERCHGAGSAHAASQDPADIFNPRTDLDVDRANQVCAQCHIRGLSRETFTTFFAEATEQTPGRSPFPAILGPTGQLQCYKIGDDINAYYVWDAGSPAAAGSGLTAGRFSSQYWGGEPSGGNFVASRQHHQQYNDMLNGPHAAIRCFDCHETHDNRSPTGFQVVTERLVSAGEGGGEIRIKTSADDNTLCLSCHAGNGPFAEITLQEVADVSLNGPSSNLKTIVIQHTQHVYNPQGNDKPVLGFPGDAVGNLRASNCVECHMPFTARTAVNFDIRAHTFNIIRPAQSLSTSPSAGVPNSCNLCHNATTDDQLQALEADYVAKFPLDEAGNINPAARTNRYVDEWLQSGHADFAGEPFNDWNGPPGQIPTTCAKCHSTDGFRDFAADGQVTATVPSNPVRDPKQVVACGACHTQGTNPEFWTNDNTLYDDRATFTALEPVTFPSGDVKTLNGPSNMCMACHQGRSSGVQVAEAAAARDQNTFINRHYLAAAAILFGTEVDAGFEYRDKAQYLGQNTFPGHPANLKTCTGCHLREGNADHPDHTFEPVPADCSTCHLGIGEEFEAIGLPFNAANVDYDADGTGESFQGELNGFAGDGVNEPMGALLQAIQTYATAQNQPIVYGPGTYPYWFKDTNANGTLDAGEGVQANRFTTFDDRLLEAAFNFHSAQDPCSFVHNHKYVIQTLYDAMDNLDDNQQNNSVQIGGQAAIRPGQAPTPPTPPAGAPTANAGADQTGVAVGTVVTLNAGASTDPQNDPLTFAWQLLAPQGSTATLTGANTANPTFTADVAGTYTATVTVSDGTNTAADTVTIITVGTQPPPAIDGAALYAGAGCAGCHGATGGGGIGPNIQNINLATLRSAPSGIPAHAAIAGWTDPQAQAVVDFLSP